MPRSYSNNQSKLMSRASSSQQKLKIHLVISHKYSLHWAKVHYLFIESVHSRKLHSQLRCSHGDR